MSERREFEMTQEQLDGLLQSPTSGPVLYGSGGVPLFTTPQDRANAAWARLGRDMGFAHMTVRPIPSKGDRFFTAEVVA